MSGAWAKVTELVLKILAALGIYRAGKKSAEAAQTEDILERIAEDKKRDNEIAGLSPAERDARGRRWVRRVPEDSP